MKISEIYPWLENYLLSKKGVTSDFKTEWGWTRFLIGGKQFASFCGEDSDAPLFTVKCDPTLNIELRQSYEDIIPGYYCNKEHWNSVKSPYKVPDDIIRLMCDSGYERVFNSLTKKAKEQINLI